MTSKYAVQPWPTHPDWPEGYPGRPKPGDIDITERSYAEIEPFETPYRPALVRDVGDGDTFEIMVDLGLDVSGVTAEIRLLGHQCGLVDSRVGVDAWETTLRGKQTPKMKQLGIEARTFCEELMPVGSGVLVRTRKGGQRGSLNRWLALIMVRTNPLTPPAEARWVSIGDLLMSVGLARVWWKGWRKGRARPG